MPTLSVSDVWPSKVHDVRPPAPPEQAPAVAEALLTATPHTPCGTGTTTGDEGEPTQATTGKGLQLPELGPLVTHTGVAAFDAAHWAFDVQPAQPAAPHKGVRLERAAHWTSLAQLPHAPAWGPLITHTGVLG